MYFVKHALAALGTFDGGISVCCLILVVILAIPITQQRPGREPRPVEWRQHPKNLWDWLITPPLFLIPLRWSMLIVRIVLLAGAAFYYAQAWKRI